MTRGSTSSVYFAKELTLDDAEARLRRSALVVRRENDALYVCWPDEPPEAIVRFRRGDDVRRAAEMLGRLDDVRGIARCDRVFTITLPDLEAALVQTNTLAELQLTLGDLTDGFVRNEWNGLYQPRDGVPPERPPLTVDAIERALDADLDRLRAEVSAELDLTYGSLDVLEDALWAIVPREGELSSFRALLDRAARYVGATLVTMRGGRWSVRPGRRGGTPVVEVPSLPKTRPFEPEHEVTLCVRGRVAGRLRDATERWDLPLRGARLATLLANRDETIARFADDVRELTGSDGPARSKCRRARTRSACARAPHRDRRRARSQAHRSRAGGLHLGSLRQTARSEWSVRDAPAWGDFGEILVDDWSPAQAIRAIGPDAPADRLEKLAGVARAKKPKVASKRRPKR